jgi:hypothetical protein
VRCCPAMQDVPAVNVDLERRRIPALLAGYW